MGLSKYLALGCGIAGVAAVLFAGNAPHVRAEETARDPLLDARFAAVDGKFEECAKLADEARRRPDAIWRAHNVFATCEVFAADAAKAKIGPTAYAARIQKAIDAFNFLLNTPGVLVAEDRRRSIRFMIDELDKRIASVQTPAGSPATPSNVTPDTAR